MRLDTSCVEIDPKHPTGTVSVELDVAGIPTYVIHPNVAWDFVPHSPAIEELAAGAMRSASDRWRSGPMFRADDRPFLAATRPDACESSTSICASRSTTKE